MLQEGLREGPPQTYSTSAPRPRPAFLFNSAPPCSPRGSPLLAPGPSSRPRVLARRPRGQALLVHQGARRSGNGGGTAWGPWLPTPATKEAKARVRELTVTRDHAQLKPHVVLRGQDPQVAGGRDVELQPARL